MQLPKSYFNTQSAAKYREYLKLLPNMQQDSTHMFVMLALTFGALSFFGIFAISPTLSTIFNLQKQLSDDTSVSNQLQTKIANLSSLERQYDVMGSNLTNIYSAIPQNPEAPLVSAQVTALAQKHNLTLVDYRVAEVQLASSAKTSGMQSFVFTLQAEGNYTDMLAFTAELPKLTRLITVESMEIGRDQQNGNLELTLRCRQYFKQ